VQSFVFVAVLFASACHAGWNAPIKVGLDPLSTTTLIAIGAAAVSLVCLPLAGMPAPPAWPWLAASAIIHLLYFAALIESYRTGDLGQVFRALGRRYLRGGRCPAPSAQGVHFFCRHIGVLLFSAGSRAVDVMSDR